MGNLSIWHAPNMFATANISLWGSWTSCFGHLSRNKPYVAGANLMTLIHKLICSDEIKDSSLMTFEILFLTIALRTKFNSVEWLISKSYHPNYESSIGKDYYNMMKEYEKRVSDRPQSINNNVCIQDDIMGKTFFWIASLYSEYQDGACRPYYYGKQAKGRIEIARRFAAFIDNIDCD